MNDQKLNEYMSQMSDSDDIQVRVTAHRKAKRRLDNLQSEYDELCDLIKQSPKKKKKDIDLQTLVEELNQLDNTLSDETIDIREMIEKMMQYKNFLDNYDQLVASLKNEIVKVKTDFTSEKINLNDLL